MGYSLSDPPPTPLTMPGVRAGGVFDPLATQSTRVEAVADVPEPEPTKDYDRFEIVRLYAQGGQGHVFVARDSQLRREVALKELQPRFADRSLSRARFVREAEITGSLEHPGVVPVYALGHHEGGRPYYAMRLIQGRNLQEVINEFHDPKSTMSPAERNLKFRQLLQRFVSVCQTIAYAHSRGIVHRDIKPSNVLIGSYGEAVVVDWGLARPFHPTAGCAQDPEANAPAGSGPQFTSALNTDSTLMGTALGTPAFMSPEQADGRWDLVGPASDIYALGTTLYVLITGKMPIDFSDWPTMAQKIRTGNIPPARAANPIAPRALEAICQKAMSLAAGDRYTTALGLAGDVEHWLADEPVTAWREPWHLRAARWCRRHRTLVTSTAALTMTAMLGFAIGFVVVEQERVAREAARKTAREALDQNFSQVVERMLQQQRTPLTQDQLDYVTGMLHEYERFAADMPKDAEGQLGVVAAYVRAGEIRKVLGKYPDALDAFTKALRQYDTIPTDRANESQFQRELARAHSGLGMVHRKQGQTEEAGKEFAAAVKLSEQIAYADPGNTGLRRGVATGYTNYATFLADQNKQHEAVEAFRNALTIREEIAQASGRRDDQCEVAIVLNNLGRAIFGCERLEKDVILRRLLHQDAESQLSRARMIAESLVEQRREDSDPRYRDALATALRSLGDLSRCRPATEELMEPKDRQALVAFVDANLSEARKLHEASAAEYETLSRLNPNNPDYGTEADGIRVEMGKSLMRKSPQEALTQFDRVIARISENRTGDKRQIDILYAAYAHRHQALVRLEKFSEAAEACSKPIALKPETAGIWRSNRAVDNVRADKLDQALAEVAELVADNKSDGETIYNCACACAQAAKQNRNRAAEFSRQAVNLLKLAASKGFFQDKKNPSAVDREAVKNMHRDEDLTPLHGFDDYEKFRASLDESKPKP
ncbi:MAG: protein kinase domain-containing protein [Gemmataceae bacterium]